ncbi:hypothetical protein BUZ34_05490 [Staphylococcus haemolyticus]|uniref:hypothetical protein n=1 Tax=Staphylococcus haemolyticus TaxID=1283 RepID=UPI000E696CAD|nr:hypothetical protein [Staphylococcus haemolyticus]MCE4987165.1 hypothetical protein [Staphylococcus haemolyticus]MCE5049675.1 hypothetical protein [Staphylococcus haemolyticus]RIO63467.1 hypothetical protein BUZ34_05490 [Staphylococcus haemolyticus]
MDFTKDEIAIIYDALFHLECTTDIYSNPYSDPSKESYIEAFKSAYDKINKQSNYSKKGALYFE